MTPIVVSAASYVDACEVGNDLTGLRQWPGPLAPVILRGEWNLLRWADLFQSPCPRFSRADLFCRLALVATELLDLPLAAIPEAEREGIGVCLGTRWGSLSTDCDFLRTGTPSVFAYTLPSTAIGEVCIRHALKGPVLCLMFGDADEGEIVREASDMLLSGDASACLCLHCEAVAGDAPAGLSPSPGCNYGIAAAALLERRSPHGRTLTGRAFDMPGNTELAEMCRQFCFDCAKRNVQ